MLLWDKAKDFLSRAFTVIFLASIIVWFLQTFNFSLNVVNNSKDSILACLAGYIAPIFAPVGLNDWRIVTALTAGFMAKESVVSTLEVLTAGVGITAIMSNSSAISMLVFCLLYTPCVAAVAAIRRELGGKMGCDNCCVTMHNCLDLRPCCTYRLYRFRNITVDIFTICFITAYERNKKMPTTKKREVVGIFLSRFIVIYLRFCRSKNIFL